MKKRMIVYIDDIIDQDLEEYLVTTYTDCEVVSLEFRTDDVFSFLQDDRIRFASVVIIDSQLFLNSSKNVKKYYGEELKLFLQNECPYLKTIIITQNERYSPECTIKKYSSVDNGGDMFNYYDDTLKQSLDMLLAEKAFTETQLKMFQKNGNWDKATKDRIETSVSGLNEYNSLTKQDIDNVITLFNDIKDKLNG